MYIIEYKIKKYIRENILKIIYFFFIFLNNKKKSGNIFKFWTMN